MPFKRGIARAPIPDGFGLTAPVVPPADLEDDPDLLFKDMTDWSVVDASGVGAVPLQRSPAASRLGRQRAADPAIPARELRPVCPHRRHPFRRRGVARPHGQGDAEAGGEDRHQGGHAVGGGPGRSREGTALALQSDAPDARDSGSLGRRAGLGLRRLLPGAVPGVQRPGKGRPVHAQPPHGRDHPRGPVHRQGAGHQDQLHAAVRARHRSSPGKLLAERQYRRARGHDPLSAPARRSSSAPAAI